MNFKLVFKLTGQVLLVEAAAMLFPSTFTPGRAFSPWGSFGC